MCLSSRQILWMGISSLPWDLSWPWQPTSSPLLRLATERVLLWGGARQGHHPTTGLTPLWRWHRTLWQHWQWPGRMRHAQAGLFFTWDKSGTGELGRGPSHCLSLLDLELCKLVQLVLYFQKANLHCDSNTYRRSTWLKKSSASFYSWEFVCL